MSSAGVSDSGETATAGAVAAAQVSVREAVASGCASPGLARRWAVPLGAVAGVAAAACAPVAWPLLASGAVAGSPALVAAFAQVGAVGGGLLAEVVIRAWDRLRGSGKESGSGPDELRDALAEELERALASPSAGLRTEVAGVLRAVDAVRVALGATVETAVWQSGERIQAELMRGFRDTGTRFAEFGWMLGAVSDQVASMAESQAEIAAGTRAMLEKQQLTLMQLTLLRQEVRLGQPEVMGEGLPGVTVVPADGEHAAELDAAGVPVGGECPYPGLAAFRPQDAGVFFGREEEVAALAARLAELCVRPGLLAVIGPSGSGKSSLLRAGLLPAVASGAVPVRGSHAWLVDLMTPGRRRCWSWPPGWRHWPASLREGLRRTCGPILIGSPPPSARPCSLTRGA